jgi:hypothetical protein
MMVSPSMPYGTINAVFRFKRRSMSLAANLARLTAFLPSYSHSSLPMTSFHMVDPLVIGLYSYYSLPCVSVKRDFHKNEPRSRSSSQAFLLLGSDFDFLVTPTTVEFVFNHAPVQVKAGMVISRDDLHFPFADRTNFCHASSTSPSTTPKRKRLPVQMSRPAAARLAYNSIRAARSSGDSTLTLRLLRCSKMVFTTLSIASIGCTPRRSVVHSPISVYGQCQEKSRAKNESRGRTPFPFPGSLPHVPFTIRSAASCLFVPL